MPFCDEVDIVESVSGVGETVLLLVAGRSD